MCACMCVCVCARVPVLASDILGFMNDSLDVLKDNCREKLGSCIVFRGCTGFDWVV